MNKKESELMQELLGKLVEKIEQLEEENKTLKEKLANNTEIIGSVSDTLHVILDGDNDVISIHKTDVGAIQKRKELIEANEFKKLGVFKVELLD